ncbi:hypothetical protein WMY93_015666 [Mugilogobius chulae]|uniref:Uncharacterized protein n=1 Tax=Mugilogobius chulae TaxID=88201 RepID=A0AAW0NQR8_9GOBI
MASRGHATGPAEPHRCTGSLQANNGTCAQQLSVFPPFSSTLALIVLVLVLVGIILVSLATFHFHKRKLRKRKILRAQEEYERDRRSPARASGNELLRPCIIVRPVRCENKPRGPSAEDQGPSEAPAEVLTDDPTEILSEAPAEALTVAPTEVLTESPLRVLLRSSVRFLLRPVTVDVISGKTNSNNPAQQPSDLV